MTRPRASLVFLNWLRPTNLTQILDEQSVYYGVYESIVFNNNMNTPFAHHKAKVLNSSWDFTVHARWAAATLAESEVIIFQDDDLLLSEEAIDTLTKNVLADPVRIHGLCGRNTFPNGYSSEPVLGKCDVVLTRAAAIHRTNLPLVTQALAMFMDTGNMLPANNGEDIFMSYAIRSRYLQQHMAYDLPYTELPAPHALSDRKYHLAQRADIVVRCRAFFRM